MAIAAGIDEAGFGPLIGPLVVSACVFRVPDARADDCLWTLLAGAVTRKTSKRSSAIPIADSKDLYVRSDGLGLLERGVLGTLALGGAMPGSLADYLRRLSPRTIQEMQGYPWYAGAELPLPRQSDPVDIRLRANALTEVMARTGVALQAMRVEPVLEGDFNRLVRATRNKSVALFSVTSRLIAWAFNTCRAGSPARITVDRIGGRMRYLPALLRMFPGSTIRIVRETPEVSAYVVGHEGRSAEIAFRVNGESAALPVALASMASKYTRELFMELLNAWWAARIANLKPTAGYHPDGARFLKDVSGYITSTGIDRGLLVRCR